MSNVRPVAVEAAAHSFAGVMRESAPSESGLGVFFARTLHAARSAARAPVIRVSLATFLPRRARKLGLLARRILRSAPSREGPVLPQLDVDPALPYLALVAPDGRIVSISIKPVVGVTQADATAAIGMPIWDIAKWLTAEQWAQLLRAAEQSSDGTAKSTAMSGIAATQMSSQALVTAMRGRSGSAQHFVVQTLTSGGETIDDEGTLRNDQGRLRTIEDVSSEWFWEQGAEYRYTLVSGGSNRTPSEDTRRLIGRRRWDLVGAQPLKGTWEDHIKVLDCRLPLRNFEYRVGTGENIYIISVNGAPCYNTEGQFVGYKGTALNVTSRVRAEEAARQTKALLETASRLGRLGAWEVDLTDMTLTWSTETFAIHGIEPQMSPTFASAIQLIQPEWRDAVERAAQECAFSGVPFDIEAKAYTVRQESLWLRIIGEPERAEDGRIVRILGATQDITEKRLSAERLQELTERLTTTLESITDAFFTVDREWRFTYINREAERFFGQSRDQLLGHVVWEQFPQSAGTPFHRQYERALAEFTTVEFEEYSTLFGLWFHVTAYPSVQGLAVYFRDVSESRRVRQALLESEERYRMLFETSVDAIFQTSPDGSITRANSAACAMFGMSEQQLCMSGRAALIADDDARLRPLLEARQREGKASGQLTMVRGDASRFEAEVTSARYQSSDGHAYSNVVVRDITQRLAHEREIIRLNEELTERVRQRTAELELANTELKGFAHSLAHDLRQPLVAAKMFSEALTHAVAKDNAEEAQHCAGQIAAATSTMGNYVEALLSLAHISQVSLEIDEVDLSAVVHSLLDELQLQAPSRELVRDIEPETYAEGDVTLLRMLLQNLVGNAWKFSAHKQVARICFFTEVAADGSTVYCVQDNGTGFDMAMAGKLFGKFQRLHSQSEFQGTGIGLANAQHIVSRHGGRIWAQAATDKGATFRFTLGRPMGPQSGFSPLMP